MIYAGTKSGEIRLPANASLYLSSILKLLQYWARYTILITLSFEYITFRLNAIFS